MCNNYQNIPFWICHFVGFSLQVFREYIDALKVFLHSEAVDSGLRQAHDHEVGGVDSSELLHGSCSATLDSVNQPRPTSTAAADVFAYFIGFFTRPRPAS